MPRNNNNDRINPLQELPFFKLTDFQLKWENETNRDQVIEKMYNNGFIEFMINRDDYNDSKAFIENNSFYDSEDVSRKWGSENQTKIIHFNIRMLSKNRGKLMAFLNNMETKPDIIMLSEIGREGGRYLKHTFPDYNYEYDTTQNNSYGGVAILADKYKYNMIVKEDNYMIKTCKCAKCNFENKWVEICSDDSKFILGCIYRHPNGNINHFREALCKTLEKIPDTTQCIIGGDLNINLIHIQEQEVSDYVTDLMAKGFFPKIYLPTRITDSTCTLIDHLFVKLAKKDDKTTLISGNIFSDITDHLPIFFSID